MLNCGLAELRLVAPRDGWPSAEATAAASGADAVIDAARLYDSTEAAVADLARVYATTVRPRGTVQRVVTPRAAAGELRQAVAAGQGAGQGAGILFGPERSGLTNDDLTLADTVISVPLNPGFASLNLAQAVLLIGYEWHLAALEVPDERLDAGPGAPAPKAELMSFFRRLEALLDEGGFLFPPEKRPGMVRNIRALFQRARLTQAEVNTLHGIVSTLWRGDRKGGE